MDSRRQTTPGRLVRLLQELTEEEPAVVAAVRSPELLVDELDYALRPPRHERRVPSYGSFVLPTEPEAVWAERTTLDVSVRPAPERADDEIRRYANGLSSWTIRDAGGVNALVVFDRPASSERDLVVLAEATGATVVQRHPAGVVRLVGPFGVARWDGVGWQTGSPVAELVSRSSGGLDRQESNVLAELLRFAVHDLGSGSVGSLLVLALAEPDPVSFEVRLGVPPPLRVGRPGDLGPLLHVLGQVDGAAVFDREGTLRQLGVRLVPSRRAEREVAPLRGTRHTSARRHSHDNPCAVVVVVSDEGPVSVFRGGEEVSRTTGRGAAREG